jgi:hypothetical protein
MKKVLFMSIVLLLFIGCTQKLPVKERSALIVIKTPTMRYADMGFISKYDGYTKLQIYGLGQPLLSFDINKDTICMSLLECMSKSEFNRKILSEYYTDDMLENIFNGRPIMSSVNFVQSINGFTQKIKQNGLYEIEYVVTNKNIFFNDKINKITIKVDEQ